MEALGRQLVVELWGCQRNLNDAQAIRRGLEGAVERVGATKLDIQVHAFNPHGVSGVAVIAESHIAVHTWPEKGYVALDVFTCGPRALPEAAVAVFQELFAPEQTAVMEIRRGLQL